MESKKIRVLCKIIENGSMMGVADYLSYTPSGLAHMMTSLEHELGVKLLVRNKKGVVLTHEGQVLLQFFKEYLEKEDRIHHEIKRMREEFDSTLRLGAYASIATHWLPGIVSEFQKKHPEQRVEFTSVGHPEAYEGIETGRFDFIFAGYAKKDGFTFTSLGKDYYYAILPPGTVDVTRQTEFPIKWLENYPFIMASFGHDMEVMQILDKHDIHPNILANMSDDPVIISMVSHGWGISMLSELVLRGNQDNILMLPIYPPVCRHLGMTNRPLHELPKVKREFAQLIKKTKFENRL